jgi:hypothetical protein
VIRGFLVFDLKTCSSKKAKQRKKSWKANFNIDPVSVAGVAALAV